jgi:hypothetical protein
MNSICENLCESAALLQKRDEKNKGNQAKSNQIRVDQGVFKHFFWENLITPPIKVRQIGQTCAS